MKKVVVILACGMIVVGGCSHQKSAIVRTPATAPSVESRGELSLDQIQPTPESILPISQSDTEPPLPAVELFARARGAMADNQPYTAIQSLEKAVALDPGSFTLQMALARAYAATNNNADRVTLCLKAAVKLNPQSLEALCELGKSQLSSNQIPDAMQTLRLARATPEYQAGDDRNALVDYYLARSLQQQGYDRAATDCYLGFLDKLKYARPSTRVFPEITFFERRPDGIYNQLGKLYDRRGDRVKALEYFTLVAERSPTEFASQAQVVKTLLDLHRDDQAFVKARTILTQFHASSDSVALLRLVAGAIGQKDVVVGELRTLLKVEPKNRPALFALSEILSTSGKQSEAQQVLETAVAADPNAIDLIRKLFEIRIASGDSSAGAKFLIERMAAAPSTFTSLTSLWERLMNDPQLSQLIIASVQSFDIPANQEAVRQFWISQMAQMASRTALSRSALEKAVRSAPPFAPAFRNSVNGLYNRVDLSPDQRVAAVADLASLAKKNGDESIALQVYAQANVNEGKLAEAAAKLSDALKLESQSPDLLLNYANTLKAAGQADKAEQQLWKIVSDFPTFEGGYQALINLQVEKNNGQQAQRVLSTWQAAEPDSVASKLYESALYRLAQQPAVAENILIDALNREPWNSDVLSNVTGFFTMLNRPADAITRLEEVRAKHPKSKAILIQLLELYTSQQRKPDAIRAIGQYVEAVSDSPNLMYFAGPAYREIGEQEQGDQALLRVLQLDPRHPGANNDLGYNWADANKNLEQAESMIRIAIEQEPDNESYLDSMGWVLYKRGAFAEAKEYLTRAFLPGVVPDPQSLDHLGDVVYRMNDLAGAKEHWTRARDRLTAILQQDAGRKDLLNLQLSLQNKLRQLEQGTAVSVSPIAENTVEKNQASK